MPLGRARQECHSHARDVLDQARAQHVYMIKGQWGQWSQKQVVSLGRQSTHLPRGLPYHRHAACVGAHPGCDQYGEDCCHPVGSGTIDNVGTSGRNIPAWREPEREDTGSCEWVPEVPKNELKHRRHWWQALLNGILNFIILVLPVITWMVFAFDFIIRSIKSL